MQGFLDFSMQAKFKQPPGAASFYQLGISCGGRFSAISLSIPASDGEMSIKTMKVCVRGKVQGVFYRRWTVEKATELGLRGWVRNRSDGSVEALFSGEAHDVDEMIKSCRDGPPNALVTFLDTCLSNDDPGHRFVQWPTV